MCGDYQYYFIRDEVLVRRLLTNGGGEESSSKTSFNEGFITQFPIHSYFKKSIYPRETFIISLFINTVSR
jgi:hypothetical protein